MEDCSDDDLERIILSWTVSSISEEVAVPKIYEKNHFNSQAYLEGFKVPLIEDCKEKIRLSLNSISQSAYYELLNVLPVQSPGTFFMDIDIAHGNHIAQDGDMFLLSSQEPKQLHELNNESGVFALAKNIGHNHFFFEIKAGALLCHLRRKIGHNHYIRGFQAKTAGDINPQLRYAIFLCNMHENVHIWKTLHMDIGDKTMIKQISSSSLIAKESCPICATQMKPSDLFMNYGLNKAQGQLAAKMVCKANCDHTQSIDVAWGLVGTGKTKTVSVVLSAFLHSKARTLACAPNILYCSSLGDYLHDMIKSSELQYGLGKSVGDILLLCNVEEIKNDAVKKFCLEWKINEIMPCMLWRGKMQNLISFLEKDFREIYKSGIKGALSVLDLFKEVFGRKSNTLAKLLVTLLEYFPSNVFSQEVAKELACLFDALKGFNDLLAKEGIRNEDVMTVFGIYSGTNSTAKPLRKKFSSIKNPRAAHSHCKSSPVAPQLKPTFVADIRKSKDKCLMHLKRLENTLALPYEKDTEWIRGYLIQETTVIISLPSNAFLLHKVGTNHMKMLIVVGAEQITECQLLPTLSLPSIDHVWLIGDHTQLCPTVNNQVRFGLSLFERLISLGVEDHRLTTQYRMHPKICSLANSHIYGGKLSSAESVHWDVKKLSFDNYMFVNVDLERVPNAILFLINTIFEEWPNTTTEHQETKLEVGVLCPAEKQKVLLESSYATITLSIQPFDKLKEKVYDVLIIAAEGLPSNKNIISYLITRARQHLWIVGDEAKFATNMMWKSLIDDAKQKDSFLEPTSHSGLSASINKNSRSWDSLSHFLGITPKHKKTPCEFSWLGRPHNGKLLLPPVRDQRGENHCTLHSSLATMEFLSKHRSASLVPPEDFNTTFSASILLKKYSENHGDFGNEKSTGRERLENILGTLQKEGATSELDNTVHMLSSFQQIYDSSKKNEMSSLEAAACKPRQGKALIGTFLLSQNYHEYRPEDVYLFDHKRPILSPLSRKLSSHAVMLIGGTEGSSKILLDDGYFVLQNSQGTYFGRGGIGRVAMSTIQQLYEITL